MMTKLSMGLKISSNAFSQVMTIAMSGLSYESCFIYLDDLWQHFEKTQSKFKGFRTTSRSKLETQSEQM